ncbi:hypothetical protein KAFR_0A08220 [Kazachstania africana CBS 2517]|uniref:WSC domain-containing protein n=1 Tax=Kazachstania africana (strain ATCC 22294 / BCRC 22015 / CBS 2517 / CECT 1963 / NBRC 1671 / NRRL Y-8276) TaxID=1071382 RepID=H2APF6_KAZAF|nr:hypothetical protein KAFR_0A08220 [Kazachstania africana CBS 2517]CCF56256.1 hypothetical protein KAFR_0A08220 [Kazachstania africana CBS 2517]
MSNLLVTSLLLLLYIDFSLADPWSYKGCYSASSIESLDVSSQGYYTYQSPSYCEGLCPDSAFVGLVNGTTCYCGSSLTELNSLSAGDSSNCDTACDGWPYQTCGGSSYMDVYINDAASSSSSAAAAVSSSTTSSSTTESSTSSPKTATDTDSRSSASSTSSSSKTSSSTSTGSSSKSSSSSTAITQSSSGSSSSSSSTAIITSVQYTTEIVSASIVSQANQAANTVYVTTTSVIQTTSSLPTSNRSISSKKGLSGGAIAGIVVGVIVGVLILIALLVLFYFLHKRDKNRDNFEESKQYQPYSFGDEHATPVIVSPNRKPSSSTIHSNWINQSRSATVTSNLKSKKSYQTLVSESSSSSLNNPNIRNFTDVQRHNHPSTVFEEPAFEIYNEYNHDDDNNGNDRFSNSSLPDMMEQRQLRVVNPEDEDDGDDNELDGDYYTAIRKKIDNVGGDLSVSSDDPTYNGDETKF